MEVEIIRYRPELAAAICELQTNLWGPDVGLNRRYFEWKYEQNPYFAAPVIALAVEEERLVGMMGSMGMCWEAGTPPRTFVMPCSSDMIVLPDYRGRKLAARVTDAVLEELAERGVDHAVSVNPAEIVYRLFMVRGCRSLGPLRLLARSHTPALHSRVARRARALIGQDDTTYGALDRNLDRRGTPVSVEPQPRVRDMAELYERVGGDGRIRQRRDAVYVEWRYRNPFSRYRFLYWNERPLEGYLVLQTSARKQESEVRILDWQGTDARVRAGLIRTALDWGCFERVTIWSATLSTEAQETLAALGFVPEPRANPELPTMMTQPTRESGAWTVFGMALDDPRSWNVRMGDTDGL
jgi:GNAT superfamily N-acetyltransferase